MNINDTTEIAVDYDRLEITFKRVLNAPREVVWRVITDPALIPQWWGPAYLTTVVDTMDVRPGGTWRFLQHAPDGAIHAFNGVYQEVAPPERLVQTFEYEPYAGHGSTETATLTELADGRTEWLGVARYASLEDLQGMIDSGMESGSRELYNRLDALVSAHLVAKS